MSYYTEAIVLSLRDDVSRREHIKEHFSQIGITKYDFFDATAHDAKSVKQLYRDGAVKRWPPCFRCGNKNCNCENNVLIPQQVANFISYIKILSRISLRRTELFLLCEDDVLFHDNGINILNTFMDATPLPQEATLIQLTSPAQRPGQSLPAHIKPVRNAAISMSNPAFLINGLAAARLLKSFRCIKNTSDVWIHRTAEYDTGIDAFSLMPLVAAELSFHPDHAKFPSRIHPKGIDGTDKERASAHFKKATSVEEYLKKFNEWIC